MIKFCYTYQSYFCHFGASETEHQFDTFAEAKESHDWSFFHNDDANVSNIYKKVVITKEEQLIHQQRAEAKAKHAFDYKLDSKGYGVITCWDSSKERFFVMEEEYDGFYGRVPVLYFLESGTKAPLSDFLDNDMTASVDCDLYFAKEYVEVYYDFCCQKHEHRYNHRIPRSVRPQLALGAVEGAQA